MKIAIVGSRDFPQLERVDAFVDSLSPGDVVVSGGARGVDSRAERQARARGLAVQSILPHWNKHGRSAGFKRNHDIVAAADRVVAFWDGASRGTAHSIKLARDAGKPVEVFLPA